MAALANLVHQTSSSTGTGSFSLTAIHGKQSFNSAFGTGGADTFWYFISNHDAVEWEVGTGHLSDVATLVRDTVVDSSNAGSLVAFTPGIKDVTCDVPAENQAGAFYSVSTFGAKGDGTTTDHAAIQAAIDAAEASLFIKRVYLPDPAVAYVFNATVTIPAGVTVFGDNMKGLELSRCKPAPAFTAPLFESDEYGVNRVLRIGLTGLFIDGSSTTLTAIQVNAQESVFRDLTIKNCFTYGLHLGGISSASDEQALNNQIRDNYFAGTIGTTEFFDGLFIDYFSADNTITGNYIEASKDAGIRSRGYNNKITNNHIYSVAGTGGGVGCGIYTETSADHDISQNYVELCAAEGVLVAGGGSDVATLAATISGNVFRNIDTGNTSNGVIEISGSDVSGVTVYGNVVRRDAATSYATPYFVYFNGITPTRAKVFGNEWQTSLITTAETNIALPLAVDLNVVNLIQTGYTDLTEIAEPASPAANVARVRAIDDGTGVTTVGHKDSAGNVVPWSHFNQSGTGNVTRTQQAKLRDFVNVKDFGALGNGSANDTTAVVNAIASLPATGGVVYFPVGVYMVDPDQLVLGNGTNSAISTINDIALVGDSASPYLPSSGVTIKARSSGTVLLDIRGAIFGLRIDNIVFDCDGQCSRGWQAYSVNNSSFRNVGIINFTEYGIFGHCRTGPMGGVAWAAGNIFQNFHITSEDVVDFGSGIILDGSFADGLDWHRTIFQGGVVQVNKGAVSQTTAIHLLFTDSCTWIEVDCGVTGAGAGGGFGIQFNGTSNALYPQNHFFYGCSIEDGINVAGTISKNYFVNFCTRDSEIVPTHANLIGFTDQGQFFGDQSFRNLVDISGAAAGQIKFPATQNPSSDVNTLDDYEEGTWTPAITFVTNGNLSVTYSNQAGQYTKVGNKVTVWFTLVTSAFTHTTASGALQITGLPFTVGSNSHRGSVEWAGVTKANYTQLTPVAVTANSIVQVTASGSGQAIATISTGDMPTGGTVRLIGCVTYQV